jgi:hypothetical protein
MRSQRSTGGRRARGSWLPRLAGAGAVMLLAAGGVVIYLVAARPPAARPVQALPSKVLAMQSVGLVVSARPAAATGTVQEMLLVSRAGLAFGPVPQSSLITGNPDWTADQMAGGTYVFIYIPSGQCLGSAAGPAPAGTAAGQAASPAGVRQAGLALQRCDLGAAQRWRGLSPATMSAGRAYLRFRNLATGECLTAGGALPGAGSADNAAQFSGCGAVQPWRQLVSFWWGT